MKSWFPLTDYDFYAYLASGAVVLGAADFLFNASAVLTGTNHGVLTISLIAVSCYIAGSAVAMLSSPLIEHLIARTLLRSPASIQLRLQHPRLVEKLIRSVFAPWEMAPLPQAASEALITASPKAARSHKEHSEQIFFRSHSTAVADANAKVRLDGFQNAYSMARNLCLSFAITSMMAAYAFLVLDGKLWYIFGSLILCLMMFGRFIKFYAAFSLEVFRSEFRRLGALQCV